MLLSPFLLTSMWELQKGCDKRVALNFLMLVPFNAIPHVVVTPDRNIVFIATSYLLFCHSYYEL